MAFNQQPYGYGAYGAAAAGGEVATDGTYNPRYHYQAAQNAGFNVGTDDGTSETSTRASRRSSSPRSSGRSASSRRRK
ncbi:hypothetical protein AAVH_43275 [Aphelenchoides avenae]|nr:hypothetical protein AAVH_43275 [Aphelenchus avenae]